MEYDVRLEQLGSRPLAVVRRLASSRELAKVVPDACGLVWSVVRAQKLTGAGRQVAIYWDDKINLEVGVELEAPFAGHGEVVGSATPAGAVATVDAPRPLRPSPRGTSGNPPVVRGSRLQTGRPQLGNLRSLDRRMEYRPGEDPH